MCFACFSLCVLGFFDLYFSCVSLHNCVGLLSSISFQSSCKVAIFSIISILTSDSTVTSSLQTVVSERVEPRAVVHSNDKVERSKSQE